MDLDLDLDSIFNGFGSGFGFKCVLGLDWILDLKKFMDLDLDLDLFLDMDSNPNPRIQIRTSLLAISSVPGWPTKVWQLDPAKATNGAAGWDAGVTEASDIYSRRIHNLFCDNCHSHVARALNLMKYDDSTR